MNDQAGMPPFAGDGSNICPDDFPLSQIRRGNKDKLGNRIIEVLWLSADYAIYLTPQGVFIHFSDDPARAALQRSDFTTICPELCELRYLTGEMHGEHINPIQFLRKLFRKEPRNQGHSIFDHNIAQALMLLMEGKLEDAKEIAVAARDMASMRSTNDNTIRYVRAAIFSALLAAVLLRILYGGFTFVAASAMDARIPPFFVAAAYGVLGATFSIITRVQSFEMKPCQQSNMNYWMAFIRIMIGLIGGMSLFLLVQSKIGRSVFSGATMSGWEGAALVGFLGGFAERLVRTVFQQTAAGIEGKFGTPAQLQASRQASKATDTSSVGGTGAAPSAGGAIGKAPIPAV